MATITTQNGTAVNIGFPTTAGGISITVPSSITTKLTLQSADYSLGAENVRTTDEVGNTMSSSWLDPHGKATLDFIIKGTGIADAQAATTLAAIPPGTLLTIAACTAMPDLVGTNWEMMDSPKITGSNKDAKKLSCNLEKHAGITAAMSA